MKTSVILYLALARMNPALNPVVRVRSDAEVEKIEVLGATLLSAAFWTQCHTASERARAWLDKATTVSPRYASLQEAVRGVDLPVSTAQPIRRMFRRMGSGRRHARDNGGRIATILSRVVVTPITAQDLEPVAEVWGMAFPSLAEAFGQALRLISYVELSISDPEALKADRRKDIRAAYQDFTAAVRAAFPEVEFRVTPPAAAAEEAEVAVAAEASAVAE